MRRSRKRRRALSYQDTQGLEYRGWPCKDREYSQTPSLSWTCHTIKFYSIASNSFNYADKNSKLMKRLSIRISWLIRTFIFKIMPRIISWTLNKLKRSILITISKLIAPREADKISFKTLLGYLSSKSNPKDQRDLPASS